MNIDNRIKKIAADVFFIQEERIVPGVDFMDDFGVDSLTIFEFVRSIEDEFNLDLNSLGLDSFRNLDNTCKVVASKL
jgi:acyl carrier protein